MEPKVDKKQQKNGIEIGVEFGDGKGGFRVTFGVTLSLLSIGLAPGAVSPGEEFGDSGEDSIAIFQNAGTPKGAADLRASPSAASPY